MDNVKNKKEVKKNVDGKTPTTLAVVKKTANKDVKFKQVKALAQLFSPEGRFVVVPQIELPFNFIMTSTHLINTDHSNIVMSNKDMSLRQIVVAAGPNAWVKVGDWVEINPDGFPFEDIPGKNDVGTVRKVKPPLHTFNSTQYLMFPDRLIKWRILKEEL